MYKRATKLIYVALILVIPTLLTACGGAALEGESAPASDTAGRLNVDSGATSAAPKSSLASSIASTNNVSSAAPAVSSSKATSSAASLGATSSQAPAAPETRPGLDTLPPQTTKLTLYRLYENSVTLVWDESPDNVGISRYEITRNGKLIATAADSTFILTDKNLAPQTDYSYTITAFDLAGNESGASPVLNVRTPGQSLPASSALSSTRSSANNSSQKSSLSSISSSVALSSRSSSSIESSSSLSSVSSRSAVSSAASSSAKSSSNSSGSAQSTSSTSSSTASVKSAKLTWTHPNQRENGQFLELGEIGGYEIRYRKSTDTRYTYIVIKGNLVTEYTHADAADTEFEIAVFDINGVYSSFVKVAQ